MMEKGALWVFSVVLILTGAFIASATSDVAYIYRREFKIDDNILEVFNESGLTVDLIDEQDLPVPFSEYRLIFVGDENFRRENQIPINSYPSIVANYYHSPFWGLTDAEGVSQLASDHALSVVKDSRMIQVHTQARKWLGGPALPYYYLDEINKAPGLDTVATTETTASGPAFGDVISYAEAGAQLHGGVTQYSRLCFYGIIESDFWTSAARDMFEDCIGFVAAECEVDEDCADPEYGDSFCQDGDVYQVVTSYTCNDEVLAECVPNEEIVLVEECPFDCFAGECIGECEVDSDCGTDGPVGDLFCSEKNVTQLYEIFTCNDAGTPQAFCSSDTIDQTVETCEDLCLSGQCEEVECFDDSECDDVNASTEDVCHEPGTPESFCTNEPIVCFDDVDCGTDGLTGSPFCVGLELTQVFESFTCHNSGTAASYCSSGDEDQVIEQCTDACVIDHCEDITCYLDSECDDLNPLTLDECINPGTVLSECRNTLLNCASDDDCGFTGFTGEEFCSDRDVMKSFHNSTCLDPGTLESACLVTDEDRIIEECSELCIDGQCSEATCSLDEDCEDFNPLTFDECINPGTIISECRYTPINCASDNDCGFTGYVGEEFCSADDIYKNYQTAECINPGETLSYCDLDVTSQFIDACDFACLEGACIRCDENPDCDDSNPDTVDLCHNPGTIDSFCTNDPEQTGNITCSADTDCGTDTPLSSLFCSDVTVSQLIQTWSCNNPGTTLSFCSSDSGIEPIEVCPEYCLDGECVDIECFTHDDCDDADPTTLDICNDPGTPESFCTNNPISIVCSSDSDCGTDGFIGSPFCFDKNVTQLFQEFDCQNPGTVESFCSTTVSQLVTETCDYMCVAGECVPEQGECTPGEIRFCGTDVGECRAGINVCFVGAVWSTECFGEIIPETEICDGLDNDCDGLIDEGDVCGPGCTDECVSGERECVGSAPRVCGNSDPDPCTEWTALPPCPPGDECIDGYCETSCTSECSPGERICSGNGYQVCDDFSGDGCYEWSSTTPCSFGEVCLAGSCETTCSDQCTDGEQQCSGNGYQVCHDFSGDGCTEWSSMTPCSFGEVCISGSCQTSCSDQCIDGERRCSGNGYQVCHDFSGDGCTEWSLTTSCSFGEVCIGGQCL